MSDLYSRAISISKKPKFIKQNMVVSEAWSPGYLKYRVFRPLLKLYNIVINLKYGPNKPWLCPAAIEILRDVLGRNMIGLEYGSGRSTYFFSNLLQHLTSIEHHPDWYEQVSKELHENHSENVSYELINVPRIESKEEIEFRYKKRFDEEHKLYSDYYLRIEIFPDNHFDFILVDGRARVECSRRAILKLKSGGVFVLDNSERKRYQPVHEMLSDWPKVNTTTGLTDTTLWFKP